MASARGSGGRQWLLALALSLTLAAAGVAAQEIVLTRGSAGCAVRPPGPPNLLRAKAGDGRVTLTWDAPSNGACIDTYEVSVVPVDGQAQRMLGFAPQRTPDFKIDIEQLQNGVKYRFIVQSFSERFGTGGRSQIEATPEAPKPPRPQPQWPQLPGGDLRLCTSLMPPSAPTDLKATPGRGTIKLCWGPPSNWGCVDEYRVTAELIQSRRAFGDKPLFWVNKGGCLDMEGLQSGAEYLLKVESFSTAFGAGGAASLRARPL